MRSLIALATGAFALGFAEFIMMGISTVVASELRVSVPFTGNFVSAYALGVCIGSVILVVFRKAPPKRLILCLIAMMVAANAFCALSANAGMLLAGRFIAGIPHGAYFGIATIAAKDVAKSGKATQAVAVMVAGQTIANMVGVPFGSWLAQTFDWRAPFAFVSVWALGGLALNAAFVPRIPPATDSGILAQFGFLRKPAPWVILAAVLLGNTGLLCWWSFVTPWLTDVSHVPMSLTPLLLVVAGFGMFVGSQAGGRLSDMTTPGRMAALGQGIGCVALLLIFLFSHIEWVACVLTFVTGFAMYFIASPQQLVMVDVGEGGGEMVGAASVQIAYNIGNALGAAIGQMVLNMHLGYDWPSLAGFPFSLVATALLVVFAFRMERNYRSAEVG